MPGRLRKILYCIPNMGSGGAERQLAHLCASLTGRKLTVHVALCGGGPNMERLERSGAVIHRLSSRHNYDIRILFQLVRLIRRIKPDVVQTWLKQMDVLGGLAAMTTRVPLIISERSSADAYGGGWKNVLRVLIVGRAAAVIANSRTGQSYWRGKLRANVSLKVIRNIVPFGEIEKATCGGLEVEFSPDVKLIVAAGRLYYPKNLFKLLEALQIVLNKTDGVAALLFGEGLLREELLTYRDSLGIEARVKFMGFSSQLYDWLKRADVFVTTSVYEGNPNTVIEAIACKCPVVVSKIPAHREFLDESSAFFVSPSSPQSIADGILGALSDSEQAGEKAGRAWERVADWSADSIAGEYIEACQEILTARLRNRRNE